MKTSCHLSVARDKECGRDTYSSACIQHHPNPIESLQILHHRIIWMLHPESRRMVENHPASQRRGIRSNKHIIRPPPPHIRRVLDKSAGYSWAERTGYAEDVAEAVPKETVFHRDQLAHDVVVGELCSSADADEGHAADEVGDGFCGCADDATKSGADGAGDEDVAAVVSRMLSCGRFEREIIDATYRRPKMSDTRPIINSVMALANVYTSDTQM